MQLHLKIENEPSLPNGGPISITITGQRGIDIGRDEFLDWVLPDPSRFISGKHCEIRYSDGQYWLRDVSTNGTFVNRSEFRPDGPHALQSGDQLEIGRYIISVQVDAGVAGYEIHGQQSHETAAGGGALWDIGADTPPPINPNELRARPNAGNNGDFLDWAADIAPAAPMPSGFAPPPVMPPPVPPPASPSWDMPSPTRPAPANSPPQPAAVWSMDDLAAPTPAPQQADFSGNGHEAPRPVQEAAPDYASDVEFMPGPVVGNPVPQAPPPVIAPLPEDSAPAAAIERMVAEQPAMPAMPPAPVPPPPAYEPPPAPAPETPRRAAHGEAISDSEFKARFARAAGISEDVLRSRDAGALADLLGVFVRMTTDNLRQLNAARAQSKGAMRSANVTMIQLSDNNPLRFSPTTDDALRILFGPPTSSYLDIPRALDSSFADLKKHQVQVFAAMQTALRQLVADLDPKSIEASVPSEKSVSALLRSREARLWDHYQTSWKSRAGTTEHGMLDVFMRLFADAYDKA